MDDQRIFQAEQIVVKPELAGILKAYAKHIIVKQPATMDDINRLSMEYFSALVDAKESEEAKDEDE